MLLLVQMQASHRLPRRPAPPSLLPCHLRVCCAMGRAFLQRDFFPGGAVPLAKAVEALRVTNGLMRTCQFDYVIATTLALHANHGCAVCWSCGLAAPVPFMLLPLCVPVQHAGRKQPGAQPALHSTCIWLVWTCFYCVARPPDARTAVCSLPVLLTGPPVTAIPDRRARQRFELHHPARPLHAGVWGHLPCVQGDSRMWMCICVTICELFLFVLANERRCVCVCVVCCSF